MCAGNLSPDMIKLVCGLASEGGAPVWFEPVSVAKSIRALPVMSQLTYISPNEMEIQALADALHPCVPRAAPSEGM